MALVCRELAVALLTPLGMLRAFRAPLDGLGSSAPEARVAAAATIL